MLSRHPVNTRTRLTSARNLRGVEFDDSDAAALCEWENGITSLDVSRTYVTNAGVGLLVDGLPDLRFLDLVMCGRIAGRGAIEAALEKGVRVDFRMSDYGPRDYARVW